MIKRPPLKDYDLGPYFEVLQKHREKSHEYMQFNLPVDTKGRYLHYDEFYRKVPKGLDSDLAWALTKAARRAGRKDVFSELLVQAEKKQRRKPMFPGRSTDVIGTFFLTNLSQKAMTIVDQNATSAALEWTVRRIGEEQHIKYLFNDLVEDEAISSSQLEGASTTTVVAKKMLKTNRKPRSISEKMILGNFRMMHWSLMNKAKDLTPDLIRELHSVGVEKIDDENYFPGTFRSTDDVVVADGDGNVVHQPPLSKGLEKRMERLCDWVNTNHDDLESHNYIHPLVKAIAIHFAIGYEHPFRDGNGRVARALFYWFMFKKDYGAFRYISISNLLKEASVKYGKSYLYTETDEMDLTYFIDYQCEVVIRAVTLFKTHCEEMIHEIESFNTWLWDSGVYGQLTEKQKIVFQVAKNISVKAFTINNVKENLGCSYNTAATVLKGLVDLKLFTKKKEGKEWVFYMLDQKDIQNNWTR